MAETKNEVSTEIVPVHDDVIKNLIYTVRGQQVMLDSDLAMLYQVETKTFNQAVKRNLNRFPEKFRFQLAQEEIENLRAQNINPNGHGGRRYLPYVFTEPGIAMLSAVLHSDVAVDVSVKIMDAFVEMRHFMTNNALLFERIINVEFKQLEYQKATDEKLEKVFEYISNHAEKEQKIFFDGQIYDAFSLIISLIQKAEKEIILVDNYVNIDTLNMLAKKKAGIEVIIYTDERTKLKESDIDVFNAQYPTLILRKALNFHDRFLIIDRRAVYHIGASIKDAGKKCFAVSLLQDAEVVEMLIDKLEEKKSD